MKHWRPRIAEAVEQALAGGAETIVGLVLAPHYSRLSIGGYRERLEAALAGRAELRFVESWHDHEPFLDVLAERVRGTDAHVVFTAHSLPERILAEGDPYRDQLLETSRLVAERAGLDRLVVRLPERERDRRALARARTSSTSSTRSHARGVRAVLVCPVGFVSDHLEILWDLDVEARERAAELGLELDRIESLNDDPAFIRALAELVRKPFQYPQSVKPARSSPRTSAGASASTRKRNVTLKEAIVRRRHLRPDGHLGAPRRLVHGRAGRGGRASSGGTARARRRCCG